MNISYNKSIANFRIYGNWNKQAKALQEKYPVLTDEDLRFRFDGEEELLMRMSARLGKNREEVIWIIKNEQPEKL